MKRTLRYAALAALLAIAAIPALAAQSTADLKAQADQAIQKFKTTDPSLEKFFDTAAGYVVFPDVGEGGLVVGGAHGAGVVYQKGAAIGKATMTQVSVGAQAGGQTFAEVIFFETPEALQSFKESQFEMSAKVSAVAAAEGAAKSANYQQGVAVFTLPKNGLMAQAAVGGQKFKFEPMQQ